MDGVAFGLVFGHARVGAAEHRFVEAVSKLLGGLLHLARDLLVDLGQVVLDQYVGAIALLAVSVVDEGVVKGVHMPGGLPNGRVHKDGSVYPDDVVV